MLEHFIHLHLSIMYKPFKTVSASLLAAAILGVPMFALPSEAHAEVASVQQVGIVKGQVKDQNGEAAIGASVVVVGTKNITSTDIQGNFTLKNVKPGSTIRISLIGYNRQEIKWEGGPLNVVMQESGNSLNEVVVTAMGIARKEKSLTYATQQIKADDFMKVQDPNIMNSIEGKVSGVTITPSAGGAGGASKILLRGNKSILGNNAPLIVIDGIPMTNNTRGQVSDAANINYSSTGEGSDPMSMINPDDIESMNILKGANAAALYGSQAANGVVMITTKKGKEGKLDVSFTSNVTFDNVLLTPELQNNYGATVISGALQTTSWGDRLSGEKTSYTMQSAAGEKFGAFDSYLRNFAKDDIDEFYKTGVTTNNSISLSGGTEKMRTYFSYANSHANGMVERNKYNRNTFSFRQSYKFFDRVHIDINANYVETQTRNRVSGGTVFNPIYHLYTTPRNIDMDYYRHNYVADGQWTSYAMTGFVLDPMLGAYTKTTRQYTLSGAAQQWAYATARQNNPYFLINQNDGISKERRFYGSAQGRIDIYDGLSFQARVSIDHNNYDKDARRAATAWNAVQMEDFGRFWVEDEVSNEIYTDYLLSYNKTFREDYSVSASAGWVGHVRKSTYKSLDMSATSKRSDNVLWDYDDEIPVNLFDVSAAHGNGDGASRSYTSTWDKAALFTAQFGWKDAVYVDGSYRRDWYRPFKQFAYRGTPDNYGYFGFGANAILSSLLKMPKWVSYMKYRLSYSEVGNSIPNVLYNSGRIDYVTGSITVSKYNTFNPIPEKTKSFETGFETTFFNNALNFDITYYNSAMHNSYITVPATNGKVQPVNTGVIRNQGVEMTLGYDWHINGDWRWKTSLNFSFNKNKVEKIRNLKNEPAEYGLDCAGVRVLYKEGGEYGAMYATDYRRWGEDVYEHVLNPENGEVVNTGKLLHGKGDIYLDANGKPTIDGSTASVTYDEFANATENFTQSKKYSKYIGNMNSKYQLGWSNTISWKNFSLYFLINGRIGGKVISLTEGYLDNLGLSKRTGDLRDKAIAEGIYTADGQLGMVIPGAVDQIAPIQGYYETVGSNDPARYCYDATNFRLRELSIGYTFRDLLGENKNLTISAIGRNLFFIYNDAPVDPDISLSTANGLGAFENFNMPSSRSFGINLKLNF